MSALLFDLALKATVLLALGFLVDRALRGSSAAWRHLNWAIVLSGVLLLPAAAAVLPAAYIPAPALSMPEISGPGPSLEAESSDGRAESTTTTERAPGQRSGERGAAPATHVRSPGPATGPDPRGAAAMASLPWVAAVWALGASLVLLWLWASGVRAWRLGRRLEPFASDRLDRAARRLSSRLGISRPPRLLRGAASDMPSTIGVFRPRVLLPAGAESWADRRLEAVLAHELAHVRRRDCAIQLVAGLACAVYWFQPLAWLAARRLEREREYACDDEVLRLGGAASGYAASLVEVARLYRAQRLHAAVATSAARPGDLSDRVRAVLSRDRSRAPLSRTRAAAATALAALLILPLSAARATPPAPDEGAVPEEAMLPTTGAVDAGDDAGLAHDERADDGSAGSGQAEAAASWEETLAPAPAQEPADPCWDPRLSHNLNVNRNAVTSTKSLTSNDGGWEITRRTDRCRSEIVVRPEVAFTPDFTWIADLSAGGLVRVEERLEGVERRVEFRPRAGGGVDVRLWRDGRAVEIDDDGRRWIEGRIVTVLRMTGIAAEERATRILAEEGIQGVLDEVGRSMADEAQGRYLMALLEQAPLSEAELIRTLDTAGHEVGSDDKLGPVLVTAARRYPELVVGPARGAFMDAVSRVGSDGRHAETLRAMLDDARRRDPSVRTALAILALESARRGIGSDGRMADFLISIADDDAPLLDDPGVNDAYLAALRTVGSDGQEARVRRAAGLSGARD